MLHQADRCANGDTARRWTRRGGMLAAALCFAALLLGGCYEEMSRTDPWGDFADRAAAQGWGTSRGDSQRPTAEADFRPTAMAGEGWAILIRAFEGPDAARQAEALERRMRDELHVPDLWVRAEHGQVVVYRGRYDARHVADAQRDLRQTRMLVLDGRRPFGEAMLIGLELGAVGLADGAGGAAFGAAGDAVNLRSHLGEAEYSLQIAFFDQAGGADYRQAAEAYARQLREKGEQAFYLHGRTMSLVTIGLFTEDDLETHRAVSPDGVPMISQGYGPRIGELQQRFPYNLGNGMTLVEESAEGSRHEAPSFVVRLPAP